MTLEELKVKVDEKNKDINVMYQEDPGLDYCKSFLEHNNCSSIENFLEVNVYDACKCLYYICSNGNKTMDEARLLIDSVSDYLRDLDENEFKLFVDMLFYLTSYNKIDLIIEYLEEENHLKAGRMLKRFNFVDPNSNLSQQEQDSKNKDHYALLKELRRLKNECNIVGLLREANDNRDTMTLIMGIISVQKRMQKEKEEFLEVAERRLSIKPNTSTARKLLKDYFKSTYKTKSIISDLDRISFFVTNEEYKRKNHERLVEKEIRANEQAYNMLVKEAQKEEIKDAKSIVKRIKDEELKNMFLRFIYEHNMKYYKVLDKDLEKVRENSSTKYLDELSKYRVVIDAKEVHELMDNSFSDFKEILLIINRYSLKESDVIQILKTTNLELVKKIDYYIREGIVNTSYFRCNIEAFDTNENIINIIDSNVNLLSNNGINPKLFCNCLDILLYEGDILSKNIKILDDYQLKGSLKTTDNYMFLLDSKLVDKIDRLIELGYINFLEEDLNILNSNNLKRLDVLKAMNIPISSLDEVREVLNNDKFMINDDYIDEYIPNVLEYKDKIDLSCSILDLENYRVDDRTYSINGMLISSNKVKRLLDNGYDMYDACFYNTLLSEDEYSKIMEVIKQYSYKI